MEARSERSGRKKRERFPKLSEEREAELKRYQEWLFEKELANGTICSYSDTFRAFFSVYPELTKVNMIQFKATLIETRAPATAALRCIAMNKYCDFVNRPDCKVKGIRRSNRTRMDDVPTLEEYHHLLDCLKKDEDWKGYFIVKFLAKTGARVGELVRMKKSDLEAGETEVWNKGRVRRVLIPDALIEESRWYFRTVEGEYLFPNRYGKRMTTRGLGTLISEMERYGVRAEVLHPHAFRHLYAIMFLKQNENIALLADLMGHANVDTTRIYLTLSAQDQKDQLNDAVSAW